MDLNQISLCKFPYNHCTYLMCSARISLSFFNNANIQEKSEKRKSIPTFNTSLTFIHISIYSVGHTIQMRISLGECAFFIFAYLIAACFILYSLMQQPLNITFQGLLISILIKHYVYIRINHIMYICLYLQCRISRSPLFQG